MTLVATITKQIRLLQYHLDTSFNSTNAALSSATEAHWEWNSCTISKGHRLHQTQAPERARE